MKINSKIRYGLRTMIELAMKENNAGTFQKEIAKNQNISEKYLDHIISALKISGLIRNVDGKRSGYTLTRKASDISVAEIFKAFEPEIISVDCISFDEVCEKEQKCAAKSFWGGLNSHMTEYLKSVSLNKLAKHQMSLIK